MLVDAHCHLNLYLQQKKFGTDLNQIIKTIERNKIVTITNSMDLTSYNFNNEISAKSSFILTAFGIHPWNAHRYYDKKRLLEKIINKNNIIGEIGLDYYFVKDKSKYPMQRELFEFFLSLSKDKVLCIHTKGAEKEVLDLIKKYGNKRIIIHWHSGKLNVLKKMIKENFYFSITPEIKNSEHIRDIVKLIPLNLILSETDNPGGPLSYACKIDAPTILNDVIEEIAVIKNKSSQEVKETIYRNFCFLAGDFIPEGLIKEI